MARKPVHLVFVEEKNKGDDCVDHNKFYDMIEKDGECHCYWGRRQDGYEFGKSGKLTVYPMSKWDSTLSSKLRKGYEDYTYVIEELFERQAVPTSKDGSIYAPIPEHRIAEIIDRLQRYANEVINANYSVKAGQVTNAMVNETQKCLDYMINATSLDEFNNYLLTIFKIIPRSMRRVDEYLANSSNDMARILLREQDLLDVMRGQVITPVKGQKVVTQAGDKKTILQLNGIEMCDCTASDIELIKRKLGNDAGRFKAAWRFENNAQKAKYDSYCNKEGIKIGGRQTKLLWHGTRNENVWSIMKTGLVLRPSNAVITGKMFGYGIYFAPLARKSIGYTSLSGSYWTRGTSNSGFMILHEVAYGTPYDAYSFEQKFQTFDYAKLRKAAPGANCLHAHAGSMLRNDEIIVYKEEQLSPLFLVELSN